MSANEPTPNALLLRAHKLSNSGPEEAGHPQVGNWASTAQPQPRQGESGYSRSMEGGNTPGSDRARDEDGDKCGPPPAPLVPLYGPDNEANSHPAKKGDHPRDLPADQHSTAAPAAAAVTLSTPSTGIKTLGVGDTKEDGQAAASSSQDPKWKRSFLMVIHLPKDDNAMRVTCLDTGADVDVISIHVVNSLGLAKEPYQGPALKPIGGTYTPQWQVKFDWHVSNFHKTYTSTFAVLDEQHSNDFDVLLGRKSVEEIQFYQVNDKVWLTVAAQPILPSIVVEQGMKD
ncbi:MAG: hypothetical protein Q9168_005301 [Polycauliona sp. 1 TL-2023]